MRDYSDYSENSFICEWCGTLIIDSPEGFVSECEHYRIPEEFKVNSTPGFSVEIEVDTEKVLDRKD